MSRASLVLTGSLLALLTYWGWRLYQMVWPQLDQELPDLGSLVRYLLGWLFLLVCWGLVAYLNYRLAFRWWMHLPAKRPYYWSWQCAQAGLIFEALQRRTEQEPAFVDDNVLVTLVLVGSSILVGFLADALQTRRQQQQLVHQKTEAELMALKAQLNPHFLFNALNTIYNQAQRSDNPLVAEHIAQLAGILRFSIQESMRQTISIEEEFAFLEKYLALQRARLPVLESIQVDISLDWDGLPTELAPLLLIPFVENMFQYGISLTQPVRLYLKIVVENRQLHLRGENTIVPPNDAKKGAGTGIRNARKRLALLYPARHQLQIEHRATLFIVDLRIEL